MVASDSWPDCERAVCATIANGQSWHDLPLVTFGTVVFLLFVARFVIRVILDHCEWYCLIRFDWAVGRAGRPGSKTEHSCVGCCIGMAVREYSLERIGLLTLASDRCSSARCHVPLSWLIDHERKLRVWQTSLDYLSRFGKLLEALAEA